MIDDGEIEGELRVLVKGAEDERRAAEEQAPSEFWSRTLGWVLGEKEDTEYTKLTLGRFTLNDWNIFASAKGSLEHLGVEYIDALQCNRSRCAPCLMSSKPVMLVIPTLWSRTSQTAHLVDTIQNNLTPFISMQNHYNSKDTAIRKHQQNRQAPTRVPARTTGCIDSKGGRLQISDEGTRNDVSVGAVPNDTEQRTLGNVTPIALIGAGGIGKTSIALTVLRHDRIKERFGYNRRFIRCDQFPASYANFLSRLSKVIGAGIENPEDLTSLRPFLSSGEMILFLDNAESILDPQGTDAQEIYKVVEELSQFSNICLGITSRIRTVPPRCKHLIIPVLSVESACDVFYGIYDNGGRSDIISDLVRRLDFHALSITLLATVASRNTWDYDRLAREWDTRRTQVLRTDYNESLAATIELSLASPTFRRLGPSARDLLGVIAFFPQGVDENLDWLFPTISDKKNTFDKFCLLSLTYRSNGFVTMLAPLRDYLSPKSPEFSPLLHMTKNHYFRKLSVFVDPGRPGFEEARWITSEDANVEHLLDVFISIDTNSDEVWLVCGRFMRHLYWHKKRLVVLGPKIEGLPDNHPSKPECLLRLSQSFQSVGNLAEYKRLLVRTLELWRERGQDLCVADTLTLLCDANRQLCLYKEGIPHAEEALQIYERRNDILGQAQSLKHLAWLLNDDQQLDAAETTISRAVDLFSSINDEFEICQSHRLLGRICLSKGNTGKAMIHFEIARGIASLSNWDEQLFWIHDSLALLLFIQGRFDDAHVHIERAKSHAINDPYYLGRAMESQARFWYKQRRFKKAKSEALHAANVFERLGAADDLERCGVLLRDVDKKTKSWFASLR
ncbi:TPR-like protein [Thelephora ganbajun]|uniref:TPR-like protein n=1 Tax=Thelephora ganbajun TaxID=370292 RepID=A0ACB6ZF52_THEGA|nr:TPR-like protein [Thelephora ganbajun]